MAERQVVQAVVAAKPHGEAFDLAVMPHDEVCDWAAWLDTSCHPGKGAEAAVVMGVS